MVSRAKIVFVIRGGWKPIVGFPRTSCIRELCLSAVQTDLARTSVKENAMKGEQIANLRYKLRVILLML